MGMLESLRNMIKDRLVKLSNGMPSTPEIELTFVLDVLDSIQQQTEITDISIYDKIEEHDNCTVQILSNSITGDVSIGWRQNK